MKITEEQKQVTEEQNQEFKAWDELFGVLAWKFTPTGSGDMAIDAEQVYNELKDKFDLKRKPIERESLYS